VADMWVFDPAGVLLFSNDSVCHFFSETLHLADWSYQLMLDPDHGRLENNGQNFSLKYRIPGFRRSYLFYHFGTHGEGGFSWKRANGDAFSIAAGLKAKDLVEIAQGANSVSLGASAGFFYDRQNSLLASLELARTKDYRLRFNLYPGVAKIGGISPGLVFALTREKTYLLGIQVGGTPLMPVGLAKSW
jgi:hypothetical protein